jgi:hypothetical protein
MVSAGYAMLIVIYLMKILRLRHNEHALIYSRILHQTPKGWDNIFAKALGQYPEHMRTGKALGGGQMKGFNSSDLNLKRHAMSHMWGALLSRLDVAPHENVGQDDEFDKVATFMMGYFKDIPKDRYCFFVEKDEKPKAKRRNPLEGSYPHGRTGRTVRDPLHSFCHFKYGKRGEPVVRLIKPKNTHHSFQRQTETSQLPTPKKGADCKGAKVWKIQIHC